MPFDYLALLRGVNVGGKNKLPMKDLADLFLKAGCTEAKTFIQSGNVVFNAPAKVVRQIATAVPEQIEKRFGHRPPIVVRTAEQLAVVAASNPFLQAGALEDTVHVLFLGSMPESAQVQGLDTTRSSPDAFEVRGAEVYLHLPNGSAKTKLTNAYFDSRLATISTGRNWRTVTALVAMMKG
jgi:uncharacterized protein (DUF1697 family)